MGPGPLRFDDMFCRDPVAEAGFSRLWGRLGDRLVTESPGEKATERIQPSPASDLFSSHSLGQLEPRRFVSRRRHGWV